VKEVGLIMAGTNVLHKQVQHKRGIVECTTEGLEHNIRYIMCTLE